MPAATRLSPASKYTIAEVAALTGLHRNTIRMRVKLGQLEAQVQMGKFGEEYRIPHEALVRAGLVEDLIEEPCPGGPASPGAGEEAVSCLALQPGDTASPPAIASGLSELFQRHEQAMFRLGYLQSELERLRTLAEGAESLRREQQASREELEQLRRQLDEARSQLRAAEGLRVELNEMRREQGERQDLARTIQTMEAETQRLRSALEAAAERRPWWSLRRGRSSASDPAAAM